MDRRREAHVAHVCAAVQDRELQVQLGEDRGVPSVQDAAPVHAAVHKAPGPAPRHYPFRGEAKPAGEREAPRRGHRHSPGTAILSSGEFGLRIRPAVPLNNKLTLPGGSRGPRQLRIGSRADAASFHR